MKTPLLDSLDERSRSLLLKHLELVIEANKSVNLTRIDTWEDGLVLHVEDSLIGFPEISESPDGPYADLGTGGGFPGIPLAILTGRKTTLVDARLKKTQMLDGMIKELGLSDWLRTFAGRAELLARKEPQSYSVVTARALAKLSVLMELASPLLKMNGRLICYKANIDKDELMNAKRVQKLTGMHLISDRATTLDEDINRRILVFEKQAKPEAKLPRKEGAAQKTPL